MNTAMQPATTIVHTAMATTSWKPDPPAYPRVEWTAGRVSTASTGGRSCVLLASGSGGGSAVFFGGSGVFGAVILEIAAPSSGSSFSAKSEPLFVTLSIGKNEPGRSRLWKRL